MPSSTPSVLLVEDRYFLELLDAVFSPSGICSLQTAQVSLVVAVERLAVVDPQSEIHLVLNTPAV